MTERFVDADVTAERFERLRVVDGSIMPALVYWFAGFSIAQGSQTITIGTLVAFTTLQTRLFFPVGSLLGVQAAEVNPLVAALETGVLPKPSSGKTIADSPLVKTAIAGADPNWGRIVSAAAVTMMRS